MQLSRIGRAKQNDCTTKITDYWSILTKIFIRTANEANEQISTIGTIGTISRYIH